MPIPGPSPTVGDSWAVAETGSPFWLRIAGAWVHLEGVNISVPVATERHSSEFVSLGGHRYSQRAPLARRTWTVDFSWATPAGIAALAAAVEMDEVWLASDHVLSTNMLPARSCFGAGAMVDCNGVPLPGFSSGEVVAGRVRGDVPTTLAAWGVGAQGNAVAVTYPGGTTALDSVDGQSSVTFTPDGDGDLTITMQNTYPMSGFTLTEGDAPSSWSPGESMPCRVVVDDPADTLRLKLAGVYRHDYAITIREVD